MEQQSSYTEQDFIEINKYLEKHPNAKIWATADGMEIPYRYLKYNHILNIISFVERYKNHYEGRYGVEATAKIIKNMTRLRDLHISKMGPAGKILYADPKKG